MAKPNYTVVMTAKGVPVVMHMTQVPFKCKGTSYVKAERIRTALDI